MAGTATLDINTEELLDQSALLDEIEEFQPGTLTPAGYARHDVGEAKVQATDGAAMSATFVIVTRGKLPNRNGNMVQLTPGTSGKGLQIERYNENPIVLFDHGFTMAIPVGVARTPDNKPTTKVQKSKAISTVFFSQSFPFAEEIFGLVDERILQAASIGFDPILGMRVALKPVDLEEGVESLQWGRGWDFVESELWEWSIVPIPADPGALRQRIERGTIGGLKARFLRQAFERHAEPVQKTGRGFVELPSGHVRYECDGMVLQGSPDNVQAVLDRMVQRVEVEEKPAVPTQSVDTNAAASTNAPTIQAAEPLIDPQQLAASVLAGAEPTMQHVLDAITAGVSQSVGAQLGKAVEDLRTETQSLAAEFRRASGKVD